MNAMAVINIARQQLHLDEDTYRAVLLRATGQRSLRAMTERQHLSVIEEMKRLGFKPASKRPSKHLSGPFAAKLQAMWIGLWNLGIVEDKSDAALIAFVSRQTGLSSERFLRRAEDARAVVEALKAWASREAQVDWNRAPLNWLEADGAKIAWAQWRLLHPTADLVSRKGFDEAALSAAGRADWLGAMTPQDWIKVMNELGRRVRAAKKPPRKRAAAA